MNGIIFNSLRLKGFKGFEEEVVFNLGPGLNPFKADNGQGKTSIGEGIVWVVLGKNLSGNSRNINVKNNQSEGAYGELKFDFNGVSHTITRKQTSSVTIKLNDKEISQSELNEFIQGDIFLLLFNPTYFSSLEMAAQRKTIVDIMPTFGKDIILANMNNIHAKVLENERFDENDTQYYIKNRTAEVDKYEKEMEQLKGRIDFLQEPIQEVAAPTVNKDELVKQFDQKEEELQAIEGQLAGMRNEVAHNEMLKSLQQQLTMQEQMAFPQAGELQGIASEHKRITAEIARITNDTFRPEQNVIENQLKYVRKRYEELSASYNQQVQLIQQNSQPIQTACPTCNGQLPGQKIVELQNQQNQRLAQLNNHLEQIRAEHTDCYQQGNLLSEQLKQFNEQQQKNFEQFEAGKANAIQQLNVELQTITANGIQLKEQRTLFNAQKERVVIELQEKIRMAQLPSNVSQQVESLTIKATALKNEIQQLNAQIREVYGMHSAYEAYMKQLDERKKELASSQNLFVEASKRSNQATMTIQAMKEYNATFVRLLNGELEKHLNKVSIVLQKFVQSTGEIKDAFEIQYEGKKLSICSTAENIKAGLEITNMLSVLLEFKMPVFLDNAESITAYKANAEQIIEVRVVKNAKLRDSKKNPLVQSLVPENEKDSGKGSAKVTEDEGLSTSGNIELPVTTEETENLVPAK
ncbi:AAA family ATPase [Lysinibacillus sp. UGB7]|uniref:AAA family ATPase n=1 Tax=Lysinibacillus sp. UGB7 TaxID=3411039 RepID=UPI003B7C9537